MPEALSILSIGWISSFTNLRINFDSVEVAFMFSQRGSAATNF